jgi:hypothetical protein
MFESNEMFNALFDSAHKCTDPETKKMLLTAKRVAMLFRATKRYCNEHGIDAALRINNIEKEYGKFHTLGFRICIDPCFYAKVIQVVYDYSRNEFTFDRCFEKTTQTEKNSWIIDTMRYMQETAEEILENE